MAETTDSTRGSVRHSSSIRRHVTASLQRWLKTGGVLVPIIIAVVSAIAANVAVHNITLLLYVEQVVADVRTAWQMPAEPQDPNIVIVALDEDTLQQFPYRSPVDRGFLADLINTIAGFHPRAIAVDVLFDQPTEPDKDAALRGVLHDLKMP